MTDAREWLTDWEKTTLEANRMRDALLAVLAECDKITEHIDTPDPRLESTAYLHTGMARTVNRIRAAIDKALGVDDE